MAGIEPTSQPWQHRVIPLDHIDIQTDELPKMCQGHAVNCHFVVYLFR
jgi:hypothetical protein